MNRLKQPTFFDDHAALEALSKNKRVGSFPKLLPYLSAITKAYEKYVAAKGDAEVIVAVKLPAEIEAFLRGHYAHPPSDIAYIDTIREQARVNTCPMCGSMYGVTLDHVLPKASFACFAIFGLNLVPACHCNTLRGEALTGPKPGERILHPYFDDILEQRLLVARFEDLGAVPKVSVRQTLKPLHPAYPGVQFHFTSVVARTQVVEWVAKQWTAMVLKPGNVIRDFRRNPTSRLQLVAILVEELRTVDESFGSKNNWQSIFVAGLLDADVIDWLFDRFNHPGRVPNTELVAL